VPVRPVAIVGAGPVGLLLACLLEQRGVRVQVFEAEQDVSHHSRAIGIHPPGLEALSEAGVDRPLIADGVRVRHGVVVIDGRNYGNVTFDNVPSRFNFVLCVPQDRTTAALTDRLFQLAPTALQRGHEILNCAVTDSAVRLLVRGPDQRVYRTDASYVIGCDGAHSLIRRIAELDWTHKHAGPTFLMADVDDATNFGSDAVILLSDSGVVESFPLPGHQRRWVVAIDDAPPTSDAAVATMVERLVAQRTQQSAPAATATSAGAFRARQRLAPMSRGRFVLAGDAAHVISPIGGQGMNLGWLDALLLSELLGRSPLAHLTYDAVRARLAEYDRVRRKAARKAMWRANMFTLLGRGWPTPALRNAIVRSLLAPSVREQTARLVTMHGLR
jgi:2-polyprenyl-6-methoxyphenol hydroxylase-like FAD-dependent oxidoreductase